MVTALVSTSKRLKSTLFVVYCFSEKKYAQIEKNALGIVYGVTKFRKYLYGRKFELYTDHEPLTKIFVPHTGVPTLAALRLQRWALILMAYNYTIHYRRSAKNANADMLSRFPVDGARVAVERQVNCFSMADELLVAARDIAEETWKDPVMSRVFLYVLNGWPRELPDSSLQPYWNRRLDQDIETLVNACDACLAMKDKPAPAPLIPWPYSTSFWQIVHVDFGFVERVNHFMLIVSYSKWVEIELMKTGTTSEKTIYLNKTVTEKQDKMVKNHDNRGVKAWAFVLNEIVRVRNFRNGREKRLPGRVVKIQGPQSYIVEVGGRRKFVHMDRLRRSGELTLEAQEEPDLMPGMPLVQPERLAPVQAPGHVEPPAGPAPLPVPENTAVASPAPAPRRSERARKPPERLIEHC
ncbi:uncharacterized protein LOC135502790 [Lineus longissimus]|uniref:uncharacterized protein LOC135502790 n=1 Tax=Lineus longissimus TaxID=88925 RepID=UPI00315DFBC8